MKQERHCEMTRRVWWCVTDGGYQVHVRYGARIIHTERRQGTQADALLLAEQLARRYSATELLEGD